jgi:tetratricopeptide (TPR) repeat protein
MELVPGKKITDFCDENCLSTTARLQLFAQVCHAIQHAHQKGVIHRDIKPSNILVTLQDGMAVPKVIDFGIAKATEGRLTEAMVQTQLNQFIGTPAYMSPEQAEPSELDIDTRSDIYSLGVLLYELMVGRPPFDPKELLAAGLEAMRRVVRETEPPKPSTRLSAMLDTDLTTVAKQRQAAPPKLIHFVKGDLDWIVMKSLEKDRTRRYETASGFAADVERFLKNEPVVARPPSAFYRFQKMVRRNTLAFGFSTALALALIAGFGICWFLFVRERADRQRAVAAEAAAWTEAAKSGQVAGFLKQMLTGVGPAVARGRNTVLLREILDKTAGGLTNGLSGQPEVEAELRSTVGRVYQALGDYDKADAMLSAALTLRKKSSAESLPVADAISDLANVFYHQGKLTNAEAMHREALAMRRKLVGEKHAVVADSLSNLGNVLRVESKFAEAETNHRAALALRMELLGSNHVDTAASLGNLAGVLSLEGKQEEGLAMQRESLAATIRALGNDHPDVAIAMNDLADMLYAAGKLAEAEATNRTALELRIKLFGNEHPDVAFSLFNLANVVAAEGRFSEAEDLNRRALAMRRKFLGNEHPDVAGSLNNLGGVLQAEGKFSEAASMFQDALAIQRRNLPAEHEDIAGSLDNIAAARWCAGELPEAEAAFKAALAMQHKLFGPAHVDIAMSLHDLADVLLSEDRLAEAETMHRDALAMRRQLLPDPHPDVAASLNSVAHVLKERGKLDEAEATFRAALAMRKKLQTDDTVAESLNDLAGVLELEGKLADAESTSREALALREKLAPDDWTTFDTRSQLGGILVTRTNYVEAATLLLSAYDGLKRHEALIPVPNRTHLKEAVQRLVRLYEATGDSAKAATWKKLLDAAP